MSDQSEGRTGSEEGRTSPGAEPASEVEPASGGESASGSEEAREGGADRPGGLSNWLLLEGNRLAIGGGLLAGVLLALLALFWTLGYPAVRSSSPLYFLFSGLVTGNLTLVTVVLSINQLVLSRELGAPGTLSERIEGALDYRGDVESSADVAVTPNAPDRFLRFLHGEVEFRSHRLEDAAAETTDEALGDSLRSLARSLSADVSLVNRTLEADRGIFSVIAATIATNHASQLQEIAAIRHEHADSLGDDLADLLDALESILLDIDVARNYFKTVYVQKELAYLSRVLLVVGVPAIVLDGLALVFYNALGPVAIPAPAVYVVAAVAFTAGFAPLAVLFPFVLRLAWVGQRTATVAPFSAENYRS